LGSCIKIWVTTSRSQDQELLLLFLLRAGWISVTGRRRQGEQQHLQSTRAASCGEGTAGIIGDSMLGDLGNKHQ